jgi:hypothetical protein
VNVTVTNQQEVPELLAVLKQQQNLHWQLKLRANLRSKADLVGILIGPGKLHKPHHSLSCSAVSLLPCTIKPHHDLSCSSVSLFPCMIPQALPSARQEQKPEKSESQIWDQTCVNPILKLLKTLVHSPICIIPSPLHLEVSSSIKHFINPPKHPKDIQLSSEGFLLKLTQEYFKLHVQTIKFQQKMNLNILFQNLHSQICHCLRFDEIQAFLKKIAIHND